MRLGRRRYGHLNPDGSPRDTYFNFILLVLAWLFSPVALMPFYMAAHAAGEVYVYVVALINLSVYLFGAIGLRRRWRRTHEGGRWT